MSASDNQNVTETVSEEVETVEGQSESTNRRPSVRDLVKRFAGKIKGDIENPIKASDPPPIEPIEEIQLKEIDTATDSLQFYLSSSVETLQLREEARIKYMEHQKELQKEYEDKIKELHSNFCEAEKELIFLFDDEGKKAEQERLLNAWLFIDAHKWDMLCRNSYSTYKPDVFQKARQEYTFGNAGDGAQLALDLFQNEKDNEILFTGKFRKMWSTLTKSILTIRQMEDNTENRNKIQESLNLKSKTKGNKSLLREVVEGLGEVTEEIEKKLVRAEKKFERRVMVRVIGVEKKSETVRMVLIFDRNGRPCVGGLPKEDLKKQASYNGDDKIVEEDEEKIEDYCTMEQDNKGREYQFTISELLSVSGISVIDDTMKDFFKERFNSFIPHITYQRIAGFQVFNNNLNDESQSARRRRDVYDDAGDFQVVDLGLKLGLEPMEMLEEYDQTYKNGLLQNVKHNTDGGVRFVGYNETGFGFVEDRPIELYTQQIVQEGKVEGVNILYMALFDTNDQICFDTLYLKDDEDMNENKDWKKFAKDAIGNRLAYRVVGQKGEVKAILYPFQGRVKKAQLTLKDVSHLTEDTWVNVKTEGQASLRLAKIKSLPTGMILGKINEEKKGAFNQTPFMEMIRMRQRVMTEMPGIVDLEIYTEDDQLLETVREEAWPVECLEVATKEQISFMESLKAEKEEVLKEVKAEIKLLMEDVKAFTNDRTKRKDKEAFLQEAEKMMKELEAKKTEGMKEIAEEMDSVLSTLKKTMEGVKRAQALKNRNSKKRDEEKDIKN